MALKNLHSSLERYKIVSKTENMQNIDAEVACNVVDHIFKYIEICLREEKSKVKVSLFAKSFIKGILTENVRNGIKNFILNMNDKEVKDMLDDMQKELNKRRLDFNRS